jgi:hypothetical protein
MGVGDVHGRWMYKKLPNILKKTKMADTETKELQICKIQTKT